MEPRANLPYTGIASFAKFPIHTDLATVDADVAILGVPWDAGIGYRPGARFGPRGLRDASTRFAFGERGQTVSGYFDIQLDQRLLNGPRLVDCGDVDSLYLDHERTFRLATEAARTLSRRGALVVGLGGDHSVTFPLIRGLDKLGEFGIIQLDAHLDFNDHVLGVRLANGSPIRRSSELPYVGHIAQIGMRSIRAPEAAYRDALKRGNTIVMMQDLRANGVEATLDRLPPMKQAYVTIDIDAVDPAYAPGTGSPEFDGFTYAELRDLLRGIAARTRVIGFDLVEVSPPWDPTGLTAMLGAQAIVEFLGAIFAARGSTG